MYCRKCYTNLAEAVGERHCPKCQREFNPDDLRTTLARPFPSAATIAVRLLLTTAFGIAAAMVVALFQTAAASGH